MAKKVAQQKKTNKSKDTDLKNSESKNKLADQKAKSSKTKKVVAEIVDDSTDNHFLENSEVENPDRLDTAHPIAREEIDDIETDESKEIETQLPAVVSKSLSSADPLVLYLNELRKYPVLSREEEAVLTKKYYETKDPIAAEKLIKSNLRFVVKIAAEYSKFGAKMIDIIQEGNVGLMHAVRDYNPYKGARLITYAVWWIRGYIQEYLMRQFSMVRIGTTQNQRKLFYQLQREKEALEKLGHEPNIRMISEKLGIDEDEVRTMTQRMTQRDVSLDKPIDDSGNTHLSDLQTNQNSELPDEMIAHQEELSQLHQVIDELKGQLSEREKIILNERLLNDEPLTLQEIGEKYGITREAVRQMEVRVMKKIKDKMALIQGEDQD